MREKIIFVFSAIVLFVGILSFALMRATLGDLSNKEESPRAVSAAVDALQVEGLQIERWLAAEAQKEALRNPFGIGDPKTRSKAASQAANGVANKAKEAFPNQPPALVVLYDKFGVVLGRNDSALMRGERLGDAYPAMLDTILAGSTGSDVWADRQLLVSYSPVRKTTGAIIGGIALGTQFNDNRMLNVSKKTSGRVLVAAVPSADGKTITLLGKTEGETALPGEKSAAIWSALEAEGTQANLLQALKGKGDLVGLSGLPADSLGSAHGLTGYGDGQRAVIAAITPANLMGSTWVMFWPMIGVVVFGIILTVICGFMFDSYISRPISDLEEGLLAIINGQTDIRFELEHGVLGGLVFRINSLLNQLLGVAEDTTDEDGRTSIAPSTDAFAAALQVDERLATAEEASNSAELHAEDAEKYYQRIFDEYMSAKKSLGEPTDHITFASFQDRIRSSEQEMSEKQGSPVRYEIEVEGKDVILIAVPS